MVVFKRGLLLLLSAFWLSQGRGATNMAPRHIFLLIGDGLGAVHAEVAQRALARAPGDKLVFQNFPVQGWQGTRSADSPITDSAAAGTALACGVRTHNGKLGVTVDDQPVDSIAVLAQRRGWKVALLTSVSIDHATPAAFYAHVVSRGSYGDIARQLADTTFDFVGGGGMAGQRVTADGGPDNLQRAMNNGYVVMRTRAKLEQLPAGKRIFAFNHTLAGGASLPPVLATRPADIRLSEFAAAAIRHLGAAPFFMMVEGGQIDWACHGNDLGAAVREVEEFNEVVRVCLDFARRQPDTLIVVTGDHETGGLERIGEEGGMPSLLLNQKVTIEGLYKRLHTLARSKTPWRGVLPVLHELCGAKTFTAAQVAAQEEAWGGDGGGADELATLVRQQFAEQAGYRFTDHGHTGVDIPVYAFGAGAERFAGRYDNVDINARLRELMPGPAR